jgi:hypothetical protein
LGYSAIKNQILISAAEWMELEKIMLNEISQTQKGKSAVLSHVETGIGIAIHWKRGHRCNQSDWT